MIIKRAIEQYLHKPRRDFRPYKTLRPEQLELEVLKLPHKPPILWEKLKHHQRVCFLIGAQCRTFAFFCDTGTGKSILSIALANYFRDAGVARSSLVLVPRRVNVGEWAREIEKHSPGTPYTVLEEGSKRKWEILQANPDATLVIVSYAGLVRMVCEKALSHRGKMQLHPDAALVQKLCDRFQGLYLDESTAIGSERKNLAFKVCRKMMPTTPVRFALSGTPFGRDPIILWAQMYLIDAGDTLGPSIGLYRGAFFHSKLNYWGGMDYTFNKKMDATLHRVLANRSLRYEANQADLPEVVAQRKYITLPIDTEKYYQKLRHELKEAKGNVIECRNVFLRMRQLSSGFLGYRDDESGERAEFEFPYNPKLDMLLSLIESIGEGHKIIVYHDFIHSGQAIGRELAKLKIPFVHVFGGTKNPTQQINEFHVSDTQVLLLNNSMVMGLNVQVASYGIFYESPVSAMLRKQAERRIERQHSAHAKVFLYDLIVSGTMDQRILQFHQTGRDLLKAIIDGEENA